MSDDPIDAIPIDEGLDKQDEHPPHDHTPVQHRDGKPPWCKVCGLTKDGTVPVSRFDKETGR